MMMKKWMFVFAGCFFVLHSYAQYGEQVQNQNMIMNDGLFDRIMRGNKRNWDINVPVQQSGIRVEHSNGEAYTTTHSSRSSSSSRDRIRQNDARNADLRRQNWERIQENMAAARERAEREKQKKREEDDRKEMQARLRHAIATAPMYQAAAARDHWHATEGARILSEITADDFKRMPQRKETSGSDLAAGIKPKSKDSGRITIVHEQILQKDKQFDGERLQAIDVGGDGQMDRDQVKAWMDVFESPLSINIKSMSKAEKKRMRQPHILVAHDELSLDLLNLFVLPQYGLVAVVDDSLVVLRDANLGGIAWENGEHYEGVVPCGNRLIGKRGNTLYVIDGNSSKKVSDFSTDMFSLFPHDEHSVLILAWEDGLSTILNVDIEIHTYSEIARLPYDVWKIESAGETLFVLAEDAVFAVNKSGYPQKLYANGDGGVNDIVLSPQGLLIATDINIWCLESLKTLSNYYNKGAKRLWVDEHGVYALNQENDLWYFNNEQ